MKKSTITLMISIFVWTSSQVTYGQAGAKINVVHNGTSTFYSTINAAVAGASSNDTIYLPGGDILNSGDLHIDKRLTIVGCGHYPDSTLATNTTRFSSIAVVLYTGADSGSISGCYINKLQFGNWWEAVGSNINNYRIERCYLNILRLRDYGDGPQGTIVRENVIVNPVQEVAGVPTIFEKNIFLSNAGYNNPATFLNNIFYITGNFTTGGTGSIFLNNIIISTSSNTINLGTYNLYNNNLFCTTASSGGSMSCGATNTCSNNISNQFATDTFINATTSNFAYSNNYHLKPTSPGVNAGTDGTDVGIFGTPYPYKDGAVPFNPHISSKTIGTVLSPTGNLPVTIKVSAQPR